MRCTSPATVSVFAQTATVQVDITPGHIINSFDPDSALGSSIDVLSRTAVPKDIPIMVTESHISWRLTGPMSTIFAALWLADNIGSVFEGCGWAFYHYP